MSRPVGCNIAFPVIRFVQSSTICEPFSSNTVTLKHQEFVSMIPIQLCSETTPRFENEAGQRLDPCPRDSGTSFGASTRGNIGCDWEWHLPRWERSSSGLPENKKIVHCFIIPCHKDFRGTCARKKVIFAIACEQALQAILARETDHFSHLPWPKTFCLGEVSSWLTASFSFQYQ